VDVVIATEMLEHLDDETLGVLLAAISIDRKTRAIFAVPNNCMGPDEEPQHQQKWTAIAFKRLLERYFARVRIECIDEGAPRLMAFCNEPARPYKLAFTMPVKNEAADIERVLKSFRGACDVMVIGVDSLSSDATAEIATRYADEVFTFTWEKSFAKARNACINACKRRLNGPKDWIFMSEGHEHLEAGIDELLNLHQLPDSIHVVEVRREDRDHAWMFPWLFRARDDIFFENDVHNALAWDDRKSQEAQLPAVRTWHARSHENSIERATQRKSMNRQALVKRLAEDPSDSRSCYYLANEWRREDVTRSISYYERYLALPGKNRPERYQARLALSQCLIERVQQYEAQIAKATNEKAVAAWRQQQQDDLQRAYDTLIVAAADDWTRNEHWIYLGDLCHRQGNRLDQAMRFYELAAVSIGREPLTYMWIEKANYTWVPAQKLVAVYAEAGMLKDALHWCGRLAELLPEWAPPEARDEVHAHQQAIIEKMREVRS
jgi:tetratricopeptide (TPR) repeat protein